MDSTTSSAASKPALRQAFGVFRLRNFRLLLLANLSNDLAIWGFIIGLGWLVYELTHSPLMVGLAFFARGASFMAGAIIGGAAADRFPRRLVVEVVQVTLAATIALLGFVVLFGTLQLWEIFIGALAIGLCHGISNPTRLSMFRDVVGPSKLGAAVAVAGITMNLPKLIGPAGAGAFLGLIGAQGVFFFAAGSWLVSSTAILLISKPPGSAPIESEPFFRSVADGFKFVRRNHAIVGVLLLLMVFNFISQGFTNIMSNYTGDILKLGGGGYGAMMAVFGLGAVAGGSLPTINPRLARGSTLLASVATSGASVVAIGLVHSLWLAVPLLLVSGATAGATIATSFTIIQTTVDDIHRGRVVALWLLTFGLQNAAGILIGPVAEVTGIPVSFMITGGLTTGATCLVALGSPALRRLKAGQGVALPAAR